MITPALFLCSQVHLVHYKQTFGGVGEAADQTPDGLAVIGVMFEVNLIIIIVFL